MFPVVGQAGWAGFVVAVAMLPYALSQIWLIVALPPLLLSVTV
jgi:hypothetical protein